MKVELNLYSTRGKNASALSNALNKWIKNKSRHTGETQIAAKQRSSRIKAYQANSAYGVVATKL